MQVVITPGEKSPLPAEIRLLNHPDKCERDQFYYMSDDLQEVFLDDHPGRIGPPKARTPDKGSLQFRMRTFLASCIVES